jgi:MFS family permease
MATFMLIAYVMMVPIAVGDVQRTIGASFAQLQWVADAYTLTLAAFLLTAGSLADLLGRRRVFLSGLVVFGVAAVLCALAPSAPLLDLFGGLLGVGAAALLATSLALLAQAFPGRSERATAMAVWGTTIAAGLAVGPILAGALVAAFGWRSVYALLVALTLLTLVVGRFGIAESRGAGKRVDWAGLVTFAAALGALIFALVHGASVGFSSPLILILLAAAVFGVVLFGVLEWRADEPMLEIALFRRPAFTGAALAPHWQARWQTSGSPFTC